jgi:predicted metal-dependent hydrolase
VNSPSKADPLHPEARKGIELFNLGEFYEAHEPLELAWMNTHSPERDLYQGILQIGLAYFQISQSNYRGAVKMFNRGQRNLKPLGETLLGVDISQLRNDAKVVEDAIRLLGPSRLNDLDQGLIKHVLLTK